MRQYFVWGGINTRYIIRYLIKNMWMGIIVGILFFLAGSVLSQRSVRTCYSTSAIVSISQTDVIPLPENLPLRTQYSELATEDLMSDAYIQKARENTEIKDAYITAEIISNTNLISIECTSENPRSAYTFLKYIIENFDKVAKYVLEDKYFIIVRNPEIPRDSFTVGGSLPSPFLLAVAGIFLTLAVLCFLYLLPRTYKGTAKAFRQFGKDVIQIIPYYETANLPKKSLFAGIPFLKAKNNAGKEAADCETEKLAFLISQKIAKKRDKVLFFTSAQRAEGKHTVCRGICRKLADTGHDVFYMDGTLMDITSKNTLSENEIVHDEALGCDTVNPEAEKITYSTESVSALLEKMRKTKDAVIICGVTGDDSALLSVWTEFSDEVFLVIRENTADIRKINNLYNKFKNTFHKFDGCILNAFF